MRKINSVNKFMVAVVVAGGAWTVLVVWIISLVVRALCKYLGS